VSSAEQVICGALAAGSGHPPGGRPIVGREDVAREARRYRANVQRWNDLAARFRALDPRVYDTLVCAAFQVAAVVESSLYGFHPPDHHWVYPLGWYIAVTPIALRRRFPLGALLATMVAAVLVVVAAPDRGDALGGVLVAALLLEFYNAALRAGGLRLAAALVAAGALLAAAVAVSGGVESFGDGLFLVGFVAAPIALGRAVRGRRLLVAALRERADRLEAEHGERVARAAEEERARIAREMHDLVAHSVSQMTIQAAAVRRVAVADPPAAAAGLKAIETDGRSTLAEMRRLLSVLRQEEDVHGLAPQPGLSGLDRLVAQAREAGLDIRLTTEGERPGLTPGLDLTAFRIVEEALGQARDRGGSGPVSVSVRYGEHTIELEIVDGSPEGAAVAFLGGDGAGFAGLRERVALYGGELHAGGRGDTHIVRAVLPFDAVRA
jgi:signal transduction histidine kinase